MRISCNFQRLGICCPDFVLFQPFGCVFVQILLLFNGLARLLPFLVSQCFGMLSQQNEAFRVGFQGAMPFSRDLVGSTYVSVDFAGFCDDQSTRGLNPYTYACRPSSHARFHALQRKHLLVLSSPPSQEHKQYNIRIACRGTACNVSHGVRACMSHAPHPW